MTPPIRIADDVEPAPSSPRVPARGEVGEDAGRAASTEPRCGVSPEPRCGASPEVRPGAADVGDLAESLSTVLGRLVRLIRREAPITVGPGSFSALATLDRSGPMRLGDLAVREGVAPPTLTRMIANLEGAGYVVRRPDPRDRRAVRVSLTDCGHDLVVSALAARADVLRVRLEGLPDEERRALADAVPLLRALAAEVG